MEFSPECVYFYDPAEFVNLDPIINEALKNPANRTYFGARAYIALHPGLDRLSLPYVLANGRVAELRYASVFDQMGVTVCTFPATNPQAPTVFIDLWSSNPLCRDSTCLGCTGCIAPLLTFDPSPVTMGGKSEYTLSHNFMTSIRPAQPVCKHTWRPGDKTWGFDSPEVLACNPSPAVIFTAVANRVKTALSQQLFRPTKSS